MHKRGFALTAAIVALASLGFGCSNGSEEAYKAQPAFSGRKVSLSPVPTLPSTPKKTSDGYTVYGAIHDLKSRIHGSEVTTEKGITIVGYIVDSNISTAPACAVHPAGKKDPDNCTNIEIPSFWIADSKGDTKGQKIRVLGWAKNFASVYEAMKKYKGLKDPPKELYKDDVWAVDLPFPLPAVGAKVKVTGKYGYTFSKSSTGIVSDPQNGTLTYMSMQYIEPPAEPAAFALAKK